MRNSTKLSLPHENATATNGNPVIAVLGAGITGLTVAWALSAVFRNRVVLLEKEPQVGGLASTFTYQNFSFDFGSHRLHADCDLEVRRLICSLCGSDLLQRERKGQLYLKQRWLRYPPTCFDILFAFGLRDTVSFSTDLLQARLLRRCKSRRVLENFEDFAVSEVGDALYRRFYKPYAEKLYGMSPRKIADNVARSRMRKFALTSLYQNLSRSMRGRRTRYFYPRGGIGQLADSLKERFLSSGGRLLFVSRIDKLRVKNDRTIGAIDLVRADSYAETLVTEMVVSSIPLDSLYHLVTPQIMLPGSGTFDLAWRGLRLLYLITPAKVPSEHETYYFPEPHIVFGRVSELNKYSPFLNRDRERAALTLEIPCSPNDDAWNMPDDLLGALCIKDLQRLGMLRSIASGRHEFFSKKIRKVYPVYDLGWKERFNRIFKQLNALDNLYMIGRSALFLQCNMDHCMSMALQLVRHLTTGPKDKSGWEGSYPGFFQYQVRE